MLAAARAVVFLHNSWSAYSLQARSGLEEWEREWNNRHPEIPLWVAEVDPDEQAFAEQWLKQQGNEAINALERQKGGPDPWATGTKKVGDYASLGTGPVIVLRLGQVVDFEPFGWRLLGSASSREEWHRRVLDAIRSCDEMRPGPEPDPSMPPNAGAPG